MLSPKGMQANYATSQRNDLVTSWQHRRCIIPEAANTV